MQISIDAMPDHAVPCNAMLRYAMLCSDRHHGTDAGQGKTANPIPLLLCWVRKLDWLSRNPLDEPVRVTLMA